MIFGLSWMKTDECCGWFILEGQKILITGHARFVRRRIAVNLEREGQGENARERIAGLDGLRAIGCVTIIIYHYAAHFSQFFGGGVEDTPFYCVLYPIFNNGMYAVELFFVLSGFCMYYAYKDKINSCQIGIESFVLRQIKKLWPLYLVTFLVVAFFQMLLFFKIGDVLIHKTDNIANFIFGVFGTCSGVITYDVCFNGPGWTMITEAVCYLLMFCLLSVVRGRGRSFEVLVYFIVIIASQLLLPILNIPLFNYTTDRGIKAFLVGMMLCSLYEANISKKTRMHLSWICVILLTTAMLVEGGILHSTMVGIDRYDRACFIIWPLLIIVVTNNDIIGRILDCSALKRIGNASYDIYLWHFPIQMFMLFLIEVIGIPLELTNPGVFILYLCMVTVVSGASFCLRKVYCIERVLKRRHE